MDKIESLNNTKWDCKYNIVFLPKAVWPVVSTPRLGIAGTGAAQECWIEEGHLMPDHVHMMIAKQPKYLVSNVVGYIKGNRAIHLGRVYVYSGHKRNFAGQSFWVRGYFVSTVGRDEELIRNYIREQE